VQLWCFLFKVKVEVEVTLRQTVSRPVRLGVRHPSGTRDQFFFLLEIFFRQLRVCYFVAPSLTIGRVCNLLLLLVLASTVPRVSPAGLRPDHILLSKFLRLPPSVSRLSRKYGISGVPHPYKPPWLVKHTLLLRKSGGA
jgi:hypothetical protein